MSEISQEPFHATSSALPDNLNWDDWTTFRHKNGVTVYQQQEPDSKEATYMVSASVHATPEDCLKVSFPCGAQQCIILAALQLCVGALCVQ